MVERPGLVRLNSGRLSVTWSTYLLYNVKEASPELNAENRTLKTVNLSPPFPALRCPVAVRTANRTGAHLEPDVLLPEEASAAKHFSQKRLTEFSLGRACAHDVLSALGHADFPVRVGPARQPLWPKELVGSISHVANLAISAVAPIQDLAGLGIDIETIAEETFDLLKLVTSASEDSTITATATECTYLAKLLFSAKEAVFKCQFPLTGKWLEFRDVSLSLDFSQRQFSTILDGSADTVRISGAWEISDQYILSIAWIAGH